MQSETLETLREEAFRKIGRNIVGFQTMEYEMKKFVLMSTFQGNPENYEAILQKEADKIRKQTLGSVVNLFVKNVLTDKTDFDENLDLPSNEIKIDRWFTFRDPNDPKRAEKLDKKFRLLVAERNLLVHHDLIRFNDWEEPQLQDFLKKMDEQAERVGGALHELDVFNEAIQKMFEYMQTPEGQDEMNKFLDAHFESLKTESPG